MHRLKYQKTSNMFPISRPAFASLVLYVRWYTFNTHHLELLFNYFTVRFTVPHPGGLLLYPGRLVPIFLFETMTATRE
jgi:hypothetical protein